MTLDVMFSENQVSFELRMKLNEYTVKMNVLLQIFFSTACKKSNSLVKWLESNIQ